MIIELSSVWKKKYYIPILTLIVNVYVMMDFIFTENIILLSLREIKMWHCELCLIISSWWTHCIVQCSMNRNLHIPPFLFYNKQFTYLIFCFQSFHKLWLYHPKNIAVFFKIGRETTIYTFAKAVCHIF